MMWQCTSMQWGPLRAVVAALGLLLAARAVLRGRPLWLRRVARLL